MPPTPAPKDRDGSPGADRGVISLRLPEIGDEGQPGVRFIKRAVGWTLLVLAILVVGFLVVASVVRMDVTVKAAGVLEPVRIHPVRAQEGGTVREVLVETGQHVTRGQVMVRLDTLELAGQLAQLEAQRRATGVERRRSVEESPLQARQEAQRAEQARARLNSALATLRQRMVEYDLGTNLDSLLAAHRPGRHVAVDQAVGEVRSAEAEVRYSGSAADLAALSRFDRERLDTELERLDAQIRTIRERLARTEVRAPADGVVLTEQIERLPGAAVTPGTSLLEVADVAQWRTELRVAEADVHKIQVGDSVKVEVAALDQDERDLLGGRVVFVASEPLGAEGGAAAAAAGAPGAYRVVAALDRRQLDEVGIEKFRRGYSVQGHVITRSGRILTLLWNYVREKVDR